MKVFLYKLTPRYYDEKKKVWTAFADFCIEIEKIRFKVKGFMIKHQLGREFPSVIYPHNVNKDGKTGKERYTMFMAEDKAISDELRNLCRDEVLDAWATSKWKLNESYYYLNQGILRKRK